MSGLARNSSTLKLISRNGKLCTSCCTPPGGYSPISCVCFVGSGWDSVTAYISGDTVEHEGSYYNCTQAHTNREPPNAAYWDDLSPFGGSGKAPGFYTLSIIGVTVYPRINGTWNMPYHGHFANQCHWVIRMDIDGIATNFDFSPSQPPPYLEIKDVPHNDRIVWVFPMPHCGLIRNDIFNQMGTGTVSWRPGLIPEWDECTDYEFDVMVGWEGVFYRCTQAHNAGTAPACTGSKEPPNASYWDVL